MVYPISQNLALNRKLASRRLAYALAPIAAGFFFAGWGSLAAAPMQTELQHLLKTHPKLLAARKRITASEHGIDRPEPAITRLSICPAT